MFPQIEESDLRDMYQDNFLDMNATITELLQKYDTGEINVRVCHHPQSAETTQPHTLIKNITP